jgi:hypothetical protein
MHAKRLAPPALGRRPHDVFADLGKMGSLIRSSDRGAGYQLANRFRFEGPMHRHPDCAHARRPAPLRKRRKQTMSEPAGTFSGIGLAMPRTATVGVTLWPTESRACENQKQVMPAGVAWAQIKVFVLATACTCP